MHASALYRIALAAAIVAMSAANAQPPRLQDQFGNSGGLADHSGEPLLVIVASTRKLRWIGRWEAALRAQVPELVSMRVADVTDKPRPGQEKVAALLRKRVPQHVSVLIDTENHWATHHTLDTREPCLLLLDREHNIVAQFRGRPKGDLVDDVIDALRVFYPLPVES